MFRQYGDNSLDNEEDLQRTSTTSTVDLGRRTRHSSNQSLESMNCASETCSDVKTLAKLLAEYYSASSFAYIFDFTNGCIDISETDALSLTKPV